jgi:acetyltransferase-like isoleucine patch superfamily enzyme
MLFKIIDKLKYKFLLRWIKPEIIAYYNEQNTLVSFTGVSNMTHISKKQNITLGKHVFIGHFNYIDGFKKVEIGDGCQITNYVSILTHSSHNSLRYKGLDDSGLLMENILTSGDVSIDKNTYIGPHSVIMPGSKLGKNCIVSAFSYVNGEFPDYSILRGQPARIIGSTKNIDKDLIAKYPDLSKIHFD